MTNLYQSNKDKMRKKEHRFIIGIIINGCRQNRPNELEMYLEIIYECIPEYAWDMDISAYTLRNCSAFKVDNPLINYTDEQLNDIIILMRMSKQRFDPSKPLRNLTHKRRVFDSLKKMFKRCN